MAEIYNFFGDIWDYLRETYFTVDFGSYRNFDLGTAGATLAQIIIAIMLGICIAACAIYYERQHLGRPVRALLSAAAQDEESAKTLAELDCRCSLFIRHNLRRRDSSLRKLIRYVGEPEDEEEEMPAATEAPKRKKRAPVMTEMLDFATVRFYIPPALCDRAALRYQTKGNGLRALLLTVVICVVGGGLLIRLMPVLLRVTDNILTWINA